MIPSAEAHHSYQQSALLRVCWWSIVSGESQIRLMMRDSLGHT